MNAAADRPRMRGIFIGRFQPYHDGHQAMVEGIVDEVDELVIGIGSADRSHTPRDPFTAGERVLMVTRALADLETPIYTVPIEDLNRNAVWVSHVRSMCPRFDVAYSNNPLVIRLFEEAGVEVRSSSLYDRESLEGAEIRKRMRDGGDWADLVPAPVAEVVREIDGVARIEQVGDSDATDAERAGPAARSGEE